MGDTSHHLENLSLVEKLAEIQAVLKAPEIKIQKPSDTRWLAREQCVSAVRKSLPVRLMPSMKEVGMPRRMVWLYVQIYSRPLHAL